MENNQKYTISNLTLEQLRVIMSSLDIYCRLGLLQFENTIPTDIQWDDRLSYGKNSNIINLYLSQVRSLILENVDKYKDMPKDKQWSLGVGSEHVPKSCNISYELYSDINDFVCIQNGNSPRGRSNLTGNEKIEVHKTNDRIEKMINIINKIKQKSNDKL